MTLEFGKTYWGWATSTEGPWIGAFESREAAYTDAVDKSTLDVPEIWLVSGRCLEPDRPLALVGTLPSGHYRLRPGFDGELRAFLRANVTPTRWVPDGEPELVRVAEPELKVRLSHSGSGAVLVDGPTSGWVFNGSWPEGGAPPEPYKSRAEKVWALEQQRRRVKGHLTRIAREIEELCK